MATLPSGTLTFLFTDIEGSTRLLRLLGDGYGAVAARHRALMREAGAAHGGTEIDSQGDSFFFAFTRARDAVAAALDAQRRLAAEQWPDGAEVKVRMGLHTGEPTLGDEGYVGLDVVRGARIAAAAHGGQVLVSETTRVLLPAELPDAARVVDLGEHRLKDLDTPERLYQLEAAGLPSEFPLARVEEPPSREARFLEKVDAYVERQLKDAFSGLELDDDERRGGK